jgi:ubiquinone/menaquinone biosynthesis C-methylase UbiE
MKYNFKKYGQYRNDIFNKMGIDFKREKKLLDIGCGDGSDAEIFASEFGLDVYGIDIYEHLNIKYISSLKFFKGQIYNIPFKNNSFDYVFLHDVLHHIDENKQSRIKHIMGLRKAKRVCKGRGYVIILEANRYNPLLYPHMVLIGRHNHFTQKYCRKVLKDVFGENINFRSFEAHFYPAKWLNFFQFFERISEKFKIFEPFRAYNLGISKIKNNE